MFWILREHFLVDSFKAFYSILKENVDQLILAYSFSKETFVSIMMLGKNTKTTVQSPDDDTDFVPRVSQGDTLAPYNSLFTTNVNISN